MPCSSTVFVLRATLLFLLLTPNLAAQKSAAEQQLFESANRERTSRGLPAVRWSEPLAQAARKHVLLMVRQNSISHQYPGEPTLVTRLAQEGARFSVAAENVAEGPSAAVMHSGWMNSPPHRANLLDPDLDSVGIAVAARGRQLFAVQDFSRGVAGLSLEEQEEKIGELIKKQGLKLADPANARTVCANNHAHLGQPRPLAYVFFEAVDLSVLPAKLEEKISSGRFRSAAVGACAAGPAAGFAHYRFAVLLY
jgi:hypothetical protein